MRRFELGAMASASGFEVRTGEKICRPRWAASRKAKAGGGEPEICGVGFVVAAEEPVGEGSGEEGDGGEDEGLAEGAHGLGVEVEEVAEGEGVVGGVLLEEGGEVGVGGGWREWRARKPAASAAREPRTSRTTEIRWPAV